MDIGSYTAGARDNKQSAEMTADSVYAKHRASPAAVLQPKAQKDALLATDEPTIQYGGARFARSERLQESSCAGRVQRPEVGVVLQQSTAASRATTCHPMRKRDLTNFDAALYMSKLIEMGSQVEHTDIISRPNTSSTVLGLCVNICQVLRRQHSKQQVQGFVFSPGLPSCLFPLLAVYFCNALAVFWTCTGGHARCRSLLVAAGGPFLLLGDCPGCPLLRPPQRPPLPISRNFELSPSSMDAWGLIHQEFFDVG